MCGKNLSDSPRQNGPFLATETLPRSYIPYVLQPADEVGGGPLPEGEAFHPSLPCFVFLLLPPSIFGPAQVATPPHRQKRVSRHCQSSTQREKRTGVAGQNSRGRPIRAGEMSPIVHRAAAVRRERGTTMPASADGNLCVARLGFALVRLGSVRRLQDSSPLPLGSKPRTRHHSQRSWGWAHEAHGECTPLRKRTEIGPQLHLATNYCAGGV